MEHVIETFDLSRKFETRKRGRKKKPVIALDNVNLRVKDGELFGFLGPNGAGKTTLIKILCTLLLPSSGKAYVNGHDVEKEPQKVRKIISMVSGGRPQDTEY